jgi:hypothetical protein
MVTTPRIRTFVPTSARRAWAIVTRADPEGLGVGEAEGDGLTLDVGVGLGSGMGSGVAGGRMGPMSAGSRGWTR